jgi:hypothetical protein
MITVFGEGRGFRVVWLLEEMGLAYRLRPVDLLAGVENDPEFLAVNPAGFIPAIQDGEVTMVGRRLRVAAHDEGRPASRGLARIARRAPAARPGSAAASGAGKRAIGTGHFEGAAQHRKPEADDREGTQGAG